MTRKALFATFVFVLSASCQSQSLLPYSDLYEIRKGRSILATYTCEDLIEKAEDKSFSLKNLAGIRAVARCKDYKFDFSQLTELERKLYSTEIESFNSSKPGEVKTTTNFDMTMKEFKKAVKKEKDFNEKFSLYRQMRNKLKRTGERKDYIDVTSQMYKWALQTYRKNKKNKDLSEILYAAAQINARTHWTEEDGGTAGKVIEETVKVLGKKMSVAELYFIEGRIDEEAKRYPEAVKHYELTVQDIEKYQPKNLSFSMDRVLWLQAWIMYKEKNLEGAATAFEKLAAVTTDLSERSRAQFYLARCYKQLGKEEPAKVLLEGISQNDFFGYYGLVSYRELGKKLPALKTLKPANTLAFDQKLEFLPETERQIFKDLIKYREFVIAERSLNILSKQRDEELNLVLYMADKAKIYMPLFRSFARLDNAAKLEVFIAYPDLIFPKPYKDRVEDMASKTKLPPSLIYSIMKQESGFNEKARSPADAMGLMQVIPRLARQLSRKFEVPFNTNDDLYDPEINIQLGSYELMEQVRKQNGQLTFVAAAYNAGPNALSNWLKNRKRDDILEFIEEIPYDETRTYVKLIARNKLFYERISNRDDEHDFPPDFLN